MKRWKLCSYTKCFENDTESKTKQILIKNTGLRILLSTFEEALLQAHGPPILQEMVPPPHPTTDDAWVKGDWDAARLIK